MIFQNAVMLVRSLPMKSIKRFARDIFYFFFFFDHTCQPCSWRHMHRLAGHKTATLTVLFLRPSSIDLYETRPEIEWKTGVCEICFYFIPSDRVRGVFSLPVLFNRFVLCPEDLWSLHVWVPTGSPSCDENVAVYVCNLACPLLFILFLCLLLSLWPSQLYFMP